MVMSGRYSQFVLLLILVASLIWFVALRIMDGHALKLIAWKVSSFCVYGMGNKHFKLVDHTYFAWLLSCIWYIRTLRSKLFGQNEFAYILIKGVRPRN